MLQNSDRALILSRCQVGMLYVSGGNADFIRNEKLQKNLINAINRI